MTDSSVQRSFVIPVLDFSPHGPYNIRTLLADLEQIPGEVICVFNSEEVFSALYNHRRIDKYCFNKYNAGVPRSWNMGMDLAEGQAVFILNADLSITAQAVEEMERYLFELEKAVVVGPQGSILDFKTLKVARYFKKGAFDRPLRTHDVSGFLFAIHARRFLEAGLRFDARYSPCQMEEWDMGLQAVKAGLACYTVPVQGFEHHWGVSAQGGQRIINYFGREVVLGEVLKANRAKFREKWQELLEQL